LDVIMQYETDYHWYFLMPYREMKII